MKRFFSFLAAAAMLFAASCAEDSVGTDNGNETQVTFNLGLEGQSATRAIGDGTTVTDMYYQVFDANGVKLAVTPQPVQKAGEFSASDRTATINLQLAKNQKYYLVVWAQHNKSGYTVGDNMVVTANYTDVESNNENRDAFCAVHEFTPGDGKTDVTLYRPFAQLNVGVTKADWEATVNSNVNITKSEVIISKVYSTFDVRQNIFGGEVENVTFAMAARPAQTLDVELNGTPEIQADEQFQYLSMNYLMIGEKMDIGAQFCFATEDGKHVDFELATIPVERNHRTNIIGRLLTGDLDFNIKIDANFDGDIDAANPEPVEVTTAEELAAALRADALGIAVKLANDIDLPISSLGQITGGSGEYKLGGKNTKNITIDLNGKKLNITTTYWSNLGAKNDDAVFTIKNGTMTSSQPTGTWNSYDLTFSNCDYIFEDVVFEKAVAFDNAGKNVTLKDVTINETHDYYAMWITAAGQTVTIDGLTVNSDGRGIKIDEQYVGSPVKVTLNVKNATFKTAKKAAIMVKSAAGAEINAESLNIANVAADKDFAVWVDEDAAAFADKVVVNGAFCKVEGTKTAVVNNATDLRAKFASEENSIIYIENGDYLLEGKLSIAEGVTIKGNGASIFNDWGSNAFANQAHFTNTTIENVNFTNNLIIDAGIANGNVTFKDCVFGGDLAHQGVHFDSGNATIVFENCTFVGRNMFGASLTKVIFNNCTFLNKKSSQTGADKWTGVNMWGKYEFNNCVFDTEATCNVKTDGVVAEFKNCKYVNDTDITTVIRNSPNFNCTIKFE